jgi:hypothetical protein
MEQAIVISQVVISLTINMLLSTAHYDRLGSLLEMDAEIAKTICHSA